MLQETNILVYNYEDAMPKILTNTLQWVNDVISNLILYWFKPFR